MSARKKCCCNVTVGPCACSPGAPWVAGLGTSVRLRTQFSGIVNSGPSLAWGCIKLNYGIWWGATDIDPITPGNCGIPINEDTNGAFLTSCYNEGNTWRILGAGSQNGESDPFPRDLAACGITYSYGFSNGPFAYPNFGTIVGSFTFNSTVTTSIVYDASANQTTLSVQAQTVNTSSIINWTPKFRVVPPNPGYCDGVQDMTIPARNNDLIANATQNLLPIYFVWFSGSTVVSGKICGAKTYTLTNTAPAHTPYIVDRWGLQYGGLIRICSTGTCALSLR